MQDEAGASVDGEPYEWQQFPTCVIERLLWFLNPRDRATASIACKSFAEAYESPSLWRRPSLSFSKGNRSRPCFNPQSIVQRFGQYFQHLTILCRQEYRKRHKSGYRQMNHFFHLLVQADVQLNSIRMPRLMVMNKFGINQPLAVSEEMTQFLKMQNGMTDVDFTNGDNHTLPCLVILESLVAENVRHLKLQGFFHKAPELFSPLYSARYMSAITRFHGLRSLWLNYRYLTDAVMLQLAHHLEGHLEVFGVLMEKCSFISSFISGNSWHALKRKCPKMQVYLRLELRKIRSSAQVINPTFMPLQMPLASIECVLNELWMGPRDRHVFDYFRRNFADTLKHAHFELQNYDCRNIRPGLGDLVRFCPLLETLTLRLKTRRFKIKEMFDSLLEILEPMDRETRSLKVFRLTFRMLDDEHRNMRYSLVSTYVPRFEEIGIQLVMKVKK